jgi:hypothetical protein
MRTDSETRSYPLERRQVGRPKQQDPGSTVCTWLRGHEHDKLIETANSRGMSISAVVRSAVVFLLDNS